MVCTVEETKSQNTRRWRRRVGEQYECSLNARKTVGMHFSFTEKGDIVIAARMSCEYAINVLHSVIVSLYFFLRPPPSHCFYLQNIISGYCVAVGVALPSPWPSQRLPAKVFNKIAVCGVLIACILFANAFFIRRSSHIFPLVTSCALWKLVPNTIRSNVISGWMVGYGRVFFSRIRDANTPTSSYS